MYNLDDGVTGQGALLWLRHMSNCAWTPQKTYLEMWTIIQYGYFKKFIFSLSIKIVNQEWLSYDLERY